MEKGDIEAGKSAEKPAIDAEASSSGEPSSPRTPLVESAKPVSYLQLYRSDKQPGLLNSMQQIAMGLAGDMADGKNVSSFQWC
jgi:hypothetical protein